MPHDQLLSLDAIQAFFEQAIWQAGPRTKGWDEPGVLSCFGGGAGPHPFQAFAFESAAKSFEMIPQKTHPVIISWNQDAWGKEGVQLAKELRELEKQGRSPNRSHYRKAQRFTVQVYEREWLLLRSRLEPLHDGAFALLIHPENDYDRATGLKAPATPDRIEAFIA